MSDGWQKRSAVADLPAHCAAEVARRDLSAVALAKAEAPRRRGPSRDRYRWPRNELLKRWEHGTARYLPGTIPTSPRCHRIAARQGDSRSVSITPKHALLAGLAFASSLSGPALAQQAWRIAPNDNMTVGERVALAESWRWQWRFKARAGPRWMVSRTPIS